jgi:hypothetical protein
MEGVCLIFDATYSCLVWLWEIEQKKKYPYYVAVGYGVGQAPRLLCDWVLFMYDFFSFYTFLLCRLCLSDVQSAGQTVTGLSLPQSIKQANAFTSDLEQAYNIMLLNVHIDYL